VWLIFKLDTRNTIDIKVVLFIEFLMKFIRGLVSQLVTTSIVRKSYEIG